MIALLKALVPLIRLIIILCNKSLEKIEKDKAIKEQQDAQTERDKIEDNPTDWLNEHFDGGLHKESGDKTPDTKTDGAKNPVRRLFGRTKEM